MCVYATALSRLEHHQVQTEGADVQFAAEGLEALTALAPERGE
jgi:hypothetical protein